MPARQPFDYFTDPRQFGHVPAGGLQAGLPLQWPTNGTAGDLRAAIFQHCLVVAVEYALRRRPLPRPSIAKVARGGRVDLRHLRRAMRGERYMQMAEIATLASIGPDALPDRAWAHHMVTGATVTFGSQITATGQGWPGALGLMSAEQIAGEEVIAGLQGWVVVERTTAKLAVERRLDEVAGPLLDHYARQQAREAGLHTYPKRRGHSVTVRLSDPTYAPVGVDGCWDPAGPILAANLPDDWIETVHEKGLSVIDGHFIAEISDTRNGRPYTVRAVRLYPETPEDPEGEWLYIADLASVVGPEERPTLAFREQPRPPVSTQNHP